VIQERIIKMVNRFSRYNEEQLRPLLKGEKVEARIAAAYVVGENKVPLPRELIDCLSDANLDVQQMARRSLILLACRATGPSKPCPELRSQVLTLVKLGPEPTADKKLITSAAEKWHAWWGLNDPLLVKLATANQKAAADKVEGRAMIKLKLARTLAEAGLETQARARYEQIIKVYPDSVAAAEARELLEKK
jgi:hypothetical protein